MVSIRWNDDKFVATTKAKARKKLGQAIVVVERRAKMNISQSARANGYAVAGQPPNRNKGGLYRAVFSRVVSDESAICGIAVGHRYGKRLETGGYLTSAKNMAVPISPEAVRHNQRGGTARTFKKTLTLIKRGVKVPLLVEIPRGKKRAWTIHYLLTNKVYIRPHPWLRPALADSQAEIQAIFGGAE